MDTLKEIINQYHPLSDDSYEKLKQLTAKKMYNKKTFLIESRKKSNKFFIVTEGIVRVLVTDDNGEKRTGNLLKAPAIFTNVDNVRENSFLFLIEFECLTDVTVYEGNYSEFKNLSKEYRDISLFHISCLESAVFEFLYRSTILFSFDATGRYLYIKNRIPDIENLIQLNHIASYLNITPIQLSRIRKKLYSK
ncbi:MAG: Uncharacterised protein [Flavobacterium sp. SCGC AAA160-P02]|nr:MAG: Uncharacterised protein [Flavobacterium sp. SCGC AAA160-P02]